MALIESWFKQDLNKAVQVQPLHGVVFTEDNEGNLIGVRCYRDGAEENLSGELNGYVIRPDEQTVAITEGTLSGNEASILLPSDALDVQGIIHIILRLISGTTRTTICAVRAVVQRSRSQNIIDGDRVIYSIDDMLRQIAACETATNAATAAAADAQTATTAANSAANSANTNATLANEKAGEANTAALAANTQANRAKGYADAFGNVTTVTGAAGTQASVAIDTEHGSATFTIPRGVDGTGAVSTVEGISPDSNHNVSLDTLIVSQSAVETMVDGLFS